MATQLLSSCREYLEERYRKSLGIGFSGDLTSTRLPVWRVVSDDDLTTEVGIDDANAVGLILDPEIGLLLFLLPFSGQHHRVRQQVTRGLALRSQLSLERNYTGTLTDASDSYGSWRIVMHWLVPQDARDQWTNQVMEIRRDTGFSEEVSLDAIFLEQDSVLDDLRRHGVPRLLLTTRQILHQSNLSDVMQWLNADEQVAASLKGFGSTFNSPAERALAVRVLNASKDFAKDRRSVSASPLPPPTQPAELQAFHVKSFRSLRDFDLNLGSDPVRVGVVHGPNGTGKSAITEALSIALFGSSSRYRTFVDREMEPDVAASDRVGEYVQYLSPFGSQTHPSFSVNGQSFAAPSLVGADDVASVELDISSTILTQDMSQKFAWMHGDELGAMVAGGFSELASHITNFCENKIAEANGERQTFLTQYGLSKAITKISTAYDRVARNRLDELLPAFPRDFVEWMDSVKDIVLDLDDELGNSWRSWGADSGREDLAKRIAKISGNPRLISKEIRLWLEEYNQLVVRSQSCIGAVQNLIQQLTPEPAQIVSWISTWGMWIDSQASQIKQAPLTAKAATETAEIADRQRVHRKLVEDGQRVRRRLDHLTQAEAFVRESWAKEQPNACPTCGADHASEGGIMKVIAALREDLTREREQLAQEFSRSKVELDKVQTIVAHTGTGDCPVSPDQQAMVEQWVQWLIPDGTTVSDCIKNVSQRAKLISSVNLLRRSPSAPAPVDAEPLAEQAAERVASSFEDAERVFEAPTTWKPVKAKLDQILSDVVRSHLPQTLEKLWCELAYNLTSAPWLLPGRPCFSLETKKGQKRATLTVEHCLARYIFNQAEVHSFGVAWFLTRYLTHGRFYHASIVMDDPAHELDQTSFRELCRLLETLVRLHRVHEKRLSLVVMMNQENRALDLARATAGTLTILSWAAQQDKSATHVIVNGEGFFPLHPRQLFAKAAS